MFRTHFIALCVLFIIFSCEAQDNPNSCPSQKTSDNEEIVKISELDKDLIACEVYSDDVIANLLNVDVSSLKKEDMSFGKRKSICYYYTSDGKHKFFIRLAWKSEKAIENKVLENQYLKYVKGEGGDEILYQEIEKVDETQSLFAIEKDQEGKSMHILRKRFGNQAEIQLELTQPERDETLSTQLLMLIESLNE